MVEKNLLITTLFVIFIIMAPALQMNQINNIKMSNSYEKSSESRNTAIGNQLFNKQLNTSNYESEIKTLNELQSNKTNNTKQEYNLLQKVSIKTTTDPSIFVSKWNTTLTSIGSSNSSQIKLPLESTGKYNFTIDWGDSINDTITSWNQKEVTHNYIQAGEYILKINGILNGWSFNNQGDRLKIEEISQWGNLQLGNSTGYFYGSSNLRLTATDAPNMNGTTSLLAAFAECHNLGSAGNMSSWDISNVTDLSSMFIDASTFNQSLNTWNVSKVTKMKYIFLGASVFNQPLDKWNVSNVKSMSGMFNQDKNFNQPINNWDVSEVTDMSLMFTEANSFNQDIGLWNVSKVTTMNNMFTSAIAFNQPIGTWDVSSVTDMFSMFYNASAFNQPIDLWDVSKVTKMDGMFSDASTFNQPLDKWNVSQVTSMFGMFAGARSFNQDLGNWNVTQVTAMDFILSSTSLSWQNYDRLLIGWSNLHLQTGVTFDASQIPYTSSAESARQHIIDVYHWTIRDGGMANPPSIPLNLKVTVDNNEVNLVWEAPLFTSGFSIQNYTIYRSLISGTGYVLIGTTVTLNYTDTGMLGGRTYYYIVKANSEIGEGLSSNEVQAYPLSVPTAPIQLRALAGAGQIEIIWNVSINNG